MTGYIDWQEFCDWIQGRKVAHVAPTPGVMRDEKGSLDIEFTDGAAVRVRSNYEGDFSDLTPGAGIEPPTVEIIAEMTAARRKTRAAATRRAAAARSEIVEKLAVRHPLYTASIRRLFTRFDEDVRHCRDCGTTYRGGGPAKGCK